MDGMDATALGRLIRKRRQELGLTQQQLAEAVRVHVSSVISWESGEHKPIRKLGALEKTLGPLDGSRAPATVREALDLTQRQLDELRQLWQEQNQGKGSEDDGDNGASRAG
jgi:transcriptional regulator with XRE-family HTH domain